MSASTTALADTLPPSIPKLDPTGSNWTVFLFRFQDAIDAKGFWGHFDGTSKMPELLTTGTPSNKENSMGKGRTFIEIFTYSEVTGLYNGVDTLEEAGEGEVG